MSSSPEQPGPIVIDLPGLRFQCVHSRDVAEAFRLALVNAVAGAFNVAADPVLTPATIAELVDARRLAVS